MCRVQMMLSIVLVTIASQNITAQDSVQGSDSRESAFVQLRARLEGTRWLISGGGGAKDIANNMLISVDPTRYRVTPHGYKAFVRIDYSAPQILTGGESYDQLVTYEDLNCEDIAFRVLSRTYYDYRTGDAVHTFNPEKPKWATAMPDTENEIVVRSACSTLGDVVASGSSNKRKAH